MVSETNGQYFHF
jgi:hypothetical protein